MALQTGWFKIYREHVDLLSKQHYAFYLWVLFNSRANIQDSTTLLLGEPRTIKRGELLTSYMKLTDELGCHYSATRRAIQTLVSYGLIRTERVKKGHIITVVNYSELQDGAYDYRHQPDSKPTPTRQQTDTNPTTTRECNKNKKKKENKNELIVGKPSSFQDDGCESSNLVTISKPPNKTTYAPEDLDLAQRWADHSRSLWRQIKADDHKWAEAIAKVKRVCKLDTRQMNYIFEFVSTDEFWRDNCQSPAGLLKNSKNGVRKIDNILAKIKKEKYTPSQLISRLRADDEYEARTGKTISIAEKYFGIKE